MHYTDLKSTRRNGFTLVELMVAIGVTALLVSLMLTITLNVMGGWNKSSGSLTSGNQARLVLDMIARDLQGAVIKKDGNVWFAATIQQAQTNGGDAGMTDAQNWTATVSAKGKPPGTILLTDPSLYTSSYLIPNAPTGVNPAIEDYRFGQGGVWLRFFTSAQDSNKVFDPAVNNTNTVSAPRAVSYQIIRLPVVAGSNEYRYQFFRSEVGSSNTFSAGYDLFNAAYESTTETAPPATDGSGNVIGEYAAGIIRHPEDTSHNRSMLVANNVIDFGVRVFTRNSSSVTVNGTLPGALFLTPIFPDAASSTKVGFAATNTASKEPASGSPSASLITHDFPAVVEVFMRVLTDEGVLQIENLEKGLITGDWWDIALKNSKVFTRRIELNSNGL